MLLHAIAVVDGQGDGAHMQLPSPECVLNGSAAPIDRGEAIRPDRSDALTQDATDLCGHSKQFAAIFTFFHFTQAHADGFERFVATGTSRASR